jgi:hypothetical protein
MSPYRDPKPMMGVVVPAPGPTPSARTPWWEELAAAAVKAHNRPPAPEFRPPSPLALVQASLKVHRPRCRHCDRPVDRIESTMTPMSDEVVFVASCHGRREERVVTGSQVAACWADCDARALLELVGAPYFSRADRVL